MRKRLDGLSLFFLAVIGMHPVIPLIPLSSRNDLLAQEPGQSKDGEVAVKVVKYDGLKQAVTDLKGKFVVVDFWSTT